MRVRVLVLTLAYAGCAPQPIYVMPDGTRTSAPPPGYAPPPSTGPSGAEITLGILQGVNNSLMQPKRKQKMQSWLAVNAANLATCLHGTASSSGQYDLLLEDYSSPAYSAKARIHWSGVLGGDHYSDVLVAVADDSDHAAVTITVLYEDANFSPDDGCSYLHGVTM